MPPKKGKPTTTIKSPLFSGSEPLTSDDYDKLSVAGFGPPAESLLSNLNWSKQVFCMTGLKLAPDNFRITGSAIFLLGSLFKEKQITVTNYWAFTAPTILTLSVPDTSIFSFPNGSLVSEYLDSTALQFSFSQQGSLLPPETLSTAGLVGFALRAHLMPISAAFIRLWITLAPLPKATLLDSYPLASNPTFPGLKVLEGDIPLGPASSGPPLSKNWGCPITPALLLGADFNESDELPTGHMLAAALAAMLRKAVRPDILNRSSKLTERLLQINEHGISQLRELPLEFIWPLPSHPSSSSGAFLEGKKILLFNFTPP